MQKDSYALGLVYTFLSAAFWGVSAACGQYLFMYKNISAEWLVSVRLLCSGFILFAIIFTKQKGKMFAIFKDFKALFWLGVYSIIGLLMCQYTYYLTIQISNAAIATVLQYTAPAFIMIYIALRTKKMPKSREILALILAVSGVFLLATHGDLTSLNLPKKAIIIGLLSGVCVAIYSTSPVKINKKYGALTCLALGLIIAGVMSAFYTKFWTLNGVNDSSGFLALVGVIFFGTILAFGLYMLGLSILGPTKASLIASVEPISAGFFIYIWLGNRFVFMDYVGFALVLACAILLTKRR
ncbi:DMT family transporter [Campylobacter geochelonis]|uniref:Transporter n=1 Tax=Campylobacter geochelonis TaxID=1780362 RepID=A0A128EBS2_9BACT|nr:DMT family transporter [Campylobacter geochelonis]QKF70358.1 EamA/RhaT family transporter, type 3 [Campylobacter geochelonis]CZE46184.1 transporter [Campylobacter geochelonis]CZE46446.1 transporter [Campylobacter geochelonis]CZE50758.1 transporter [Campylobacter geochelonis]